MKRIFAFILMLLMISCAAVNFTACDGEGEPGGDYSPSGSDAPASESLEVSESIDEVTEAPVIQPTYFEMNPAVAVVYSWRDSELEKSAAEMVAAAIAEVYSIEVEVKTDWGYAEGGEILIGKCGYRDSSIAFSNEMYASGYGYSVLSDTEIAISAKKDENLMRAVELFIDEVIKKNDTAIYEVGTTGMRGNERPVAEYIVNGVALSEYVIVADSADIKVAQFLSDAINENLYTNVSVVEAKKFVGGHAIKLGFFGCEDYDGDRYAILSEVVGGVSTIYIDGASSALLEAGAELLVKGFIAKDPNVAEVAVPEKTYAHIGGTKIYEISSEEALLAEGVTYYRKHYNNFENKNVDVFITAVSGNSPATFGVWVADFDTYSGKAKLDVKTVGTLAMEFEKTGVNVLAATNAGFFHKSAGTNYAWGMQIVDGKVVWAPSHEDDRYSNNWVGITYDGKMVGGDVDDYEKIYKGKLKYGVGCGGSLMEDGVLIVKPSKTTASCYTAIAFTKDGGFVLVCVDGRPHLREGTSEGASLFDMMSIFRDLDIEYTDAYYLDGGGSSEMVIERNTGSTTFKTVNDPSDGSSRKVSDIIGVYIP